MWAWSRSPRVSGAATAIHPLTSSSSCELLWLSLGGGEARGLAVAGHPPPPRKLKTLGQPGGGLGPAQRRPLCSLTGLPTGFWGRQQEPVSVPVLLPAEAAGMPRVLAQPGPSGSPIAPYPHFAWAWGLAGTVLAVVLDVICLEPHSQQKNPWELSLLQRLHVP